MKRKHAAALAASLSILALSIAFFQMYSAGKNGGKTTLRVICATSLMFPLERIEEAFEKSHLEVDVEIEAHGSIQVIRQVTELNQKADLLMVADFSLIPIMMYNTTIQGSNQKYADWYMRFASNSIVLAYTNQSRYADEVNASNWCNILARSDVKFGFPNPLVDALGYRALMVIQLAEAYYGNAAIFHDLVTSNFDPPINSIPEDSNYTIIVPEVQQPRGSKVTLRASSIQLIPLLESGSIDYCFLYLSNAKQYGMTFVELPDEVNLGNPERAVSYRKVLVKFEHQRFASIGLDREGKTIYYGLSIPRNVKQSDLAVEFAKFMLSAEGRRIFEDAWHPVFVPSYVDRLENCPRELDSLVIEEP